LTFSNISTKTIHPITTIINMSMRDGVSDDFKQALVIPLIIKKTKSWQKGTKDHF